MLFTWLLDAVKDVHYLRCPGSMAERPLWTRFWHSLCVLHNSRLVGTNAQVANVPPPFKGTRTQYLLRRIREVLGGLVMFDFIETFIHSHHHLYDPSRNDAHFPSGLLGYFERSACMAVWLVMTYIVLKISYGALTIVAVGTHLWSAEDWPDIYGDLSDAYTIRRLWGRTWHQVLRRHFAHWGNWTVNTLNVPRGTFLSSQVQVHVAFALSGLLHCIGDLVVGKEVFGHSWKFFAANGIAITFEDVVILLARRIGFRHMTRVTRVVGYVWVCLWFTRSVRLYQEWMYEAGIGNQPALPYSPTKEILVPYMWVDPAL
ncbi:membrane bound O-acyl transferase family-domain-containing protein [Trametes gibbosa]|nr:membrane bound O-acyl transferase family-domain-containing protein [Trametes gibbosa]